MISGDLKSLARNIEQPIAQLKEIERSLRSAPREGIDWPKYQRRFEKAHPEFRARLVELSSEISEQEISIAILLRLEIGMPDIARMLSVSARAASQLRRDLRAKLAIPRGRRELPFLKTL
jgi:hypothetical protein